MDEFIAKGLNGCLSINGDNIKISRRNLGGFMFHGFGGDKEINISQISAIQFRKAGLSAGFIQFSFLGGTESKKGLNNAMTDENSVTFYASKNIEFLKIKKEIENRIDNLRNKSVDVQKVDSIPDQIQKLYSLKEQGILTEVEFSEKKKELLSKI